MLSTARVISASFYGATFFRTTCSNFMISDTGCWGGARGATSWADEYSEGANGQSCQLRRRASFLRSENVFAKGWQDIGGRFSNAGICQPWGVIHLI